MKITINKSDARELMYESFCGGGLTELYYCDVIMGGENEENYGKARHLLLGEGKTDICLEDVYVKMLEEYGILFMDENEDKKIHLTLGLAKENIQKALDNKKTGAFVSAEIMKIIPKYDNADAWTYFNVLQLALFSEIIYG
tara:strand:+ start:343 stop:765 length:423 start_codon:yes stop_codon:yes gene_type:complete